VSFLGSFLTFVLNNPTGAGSGSTSSSNTGYVNSLVGFKTINFVTNRPDFELLQPTITMTNVNHFFGSNVIVPGGYGDITLNLGTYYYIRVSTNTFTRFIPGGANTYNTVVVRSSSTATIDNFSSSSSNNQSILFLGESSSTSIIAIASNKTADETNVFRSITKSGAGTLTSFGASNLGLNTGITFGSPLATYAYTTGNNLAVTSPLNAKSASVIVIGGGQAGSKNATSTRGGAGGRAGSVTIQGNVPITEGTTFYINVGAGGATNGGSGNTSWVNYTTNSAPTSLPAGSLALGGNVAGTNIGSWFYLGGFGGAAGTASLTSGAGGGSAQAWDTPAVFIGAAASTGKGSGGAGVRGNGIIGNAVSNAGNGGLSYTNTSALSGANTTDTSVPAGTGESGINGGGGGGGGSRTGGTGQAGNGGNGASSGDLFYRLFDGVLQNGFASGGGGGGGGGVVTPAQTTIEGRLGGDGGTGGLGGGGGGGGGGYNAASGQTLNYSHTADSSVLTISVNTPVTNGETYSIAPVSGGAFTYTKNGNSTLVQATRNLHGYTSGQVIYVTASIGISAGSRLIEVTSTDTFRFTAGPILSFTVSSSNSAYPFAPGNYVATYTGGSTFTIPVTSTFIPESGTALVSITNANGAGGNGGGGLILVIYEVNAPATQVFILGED
jgi:hypothetical protein